MNADRELVDYVNRAINSGAKCIMVPGSLLRDATNEALEIVRQMCELCGVTIVVAGDE